MENQKDRNNKFFVPFPHFFNGKNYAIDTYLNISTLYKGKPMFVDIIFTKSKSLEEIKEDARRDIEIPGQIESVILSGQKIYQSLKNGKPSLPNSMPRLSFTSGSPGFKLKNGKRRTNLRNPFKYQLRIFR